MKLQELSLSDLYGLRESLIAKYKYEIYSSEKIEKIIENDPKNKPLLCVNNEINRRETEIINEINRRETEIINEIAEGKKENPEFADFGLQGNYPSEFPEKICLESKTLDEIFREPKNGNMDAKNYHL